MSAPALTVFVTGQGSVNGDQLNTFISSCDTYAQLRAFVGTTGIQVFARGTASLNDGGQANFVWDPSAIGPDNNATIIIPPAAASGGWVRITENTAGFFYAVDTGSLNALAIALPENLASIPVGSIIFVNPANTTTITNPTLTINGGTPVVITTPLGGALAHGAIVQGEPAELMVGPAQTIWSIFAGFGPYANAMLGQLPGTTTNDNATAGNIGEFISEQVTIIAGVPMTTGVPANITMITLTAGDWDVFGNIVFDVGVGATLSFYTTGISLNSATLPILGNDNSSQQTVASVPSSDQVSQSAGPTRISLAAPAACYLVGDVGFSGGPVGCYGFIGARRVR